MPVSIENEASFLAAMASKFNLFAGAGFSVLAEGYQGPIPVGSQLGDELRSEFDIDKGNHLDLPQLHTVINSTRPQELDLFIRNRFRVSTFDSSYGVIEKLGPQAIFTTNVDDLFTRIFHDSQSYYLNDVYAEGAALGSRSAVELIHLHGSVRDTNRPLTFGTLDIAAAASRDPDKWAFLRQRLSAAPTLYWGYSMSDSGTLQSVRSTVPGAQTIGEGWIQIRPGSAETSMADYYRALNLQLIIAETGDLLKYLSEKVALRASIQLAEPSLENLPPSSEVPARPLEDYFLGAAPSWSDIYGGSLRKTSHYRKIADRIAAGVNTVVAGIPASGKTTLLMQLAAHAPFEGPRMMFDGLGNAEAKLLARRIGSGKALIVMDNVASDADALSTLAALPNAVIVAGDRDYTLSSVSNIVSKSKTQIVGVTALSKEDVQSIWHSIPVRIRSKHLNFPEMAAGVDPSAFEFIRANVTGQLLEKRLIKYVRRMLDEDEDQAEMLILACYLHYARVPLSMDVALAYFRNRIDNYESIYAMMGAVGELMQEYEGDLQVEDQDYFAARSMMISELVLLGIPSSALRTVLLHFHNEVSPLRIPGFSSFKRRGYESRIFAQAFPNYEDGAALYDKILDKPDINRSPYVVQHKALFLAAHDEYELAFKEIDAARGSRRGHVNWTIENSYNKILFRANVEKAARLQEAIDLCERAIDGLSEAYEKDPRKGSHALVFADCAIRLSREVFDDSTLDRLNQAHRMLTEVMASEPWLERPKFARGDVYRRINELT